MRNKSLAALIGFFLAGTGLLSIIVGLVGVKLSIVAWVDLLPAPFGFLLKVIFIIAGFVIMFLALADNKSRE